ncbi:MAG: gamma-glutamylcyclotransferase family protein [Bacteroidota bacterium]
MSERTIQAFFYGLYMDETVLRDKGVDPRNPRRAVVPGYRTRIGTRATLVPRFGAQAFGMVFSVTHAELNRLYSGAGLDMYRAESVLAFFDDGTCAPVATFNLVEPPAAGEANDAYATKLRGVLERLGLPADGLE